MWILIASQQLKNIGHALSAMTTLKEIRDIEAVDKLREMSMTIAQMVLHLEHNDRESNNAISDN